MKHYIFKRIHLHALYVRAYITNLCASCMYDINVQIVSELIEYI